MPAPYLTAPSGGGDRPPFEILLDGAGSPPGSTDMALTIDAPSDPNAPTKNSLGRYNGTHTTLAHYTGTVASMARMDRGSGNTEHEYSDLTGVTITHTATSNVTTSLTAGEQYTITFSNV